MGSQKKMDRISALQEALDQAEAEITALKIGGAVADLLPVNLVPHSSWYANTVVKSKRTVLELRWEPGNATSYLLLAINQKEGSEWSVNLSNFNDRFATVDLFDGRDIDGAVEIAAEIVAAHDNDLPLGRVDIEAIRNGLRVLFAACIKSYDN